MVPEEENRLTNKTEGPAIPRPEKLNPGPRDGTTSDTFRDQGTGENKQESNKNGAYGVAQGYDNTIDESTLERKEYPTPNRGQPSGVKMFARQGKGSSNISQPGSGDGGQSLATSSRSRGRPSKRSDIPDTLSMADTSRGSRTKDGVGIGLRRSSRAAAESATQQITEQTVRFSIMC